MVGGKIYCVCCSNFSGKIVNGRKVSLHRIPVSKRRAKAWIQRLKLIRKDFPATTANVRVCSEHFKLKRGPCPDDQLPSVFPQKIFRTTCMDESQDLTGEASVTATSTSSSTEMIGKNLSLKVNTAASVQSVSLQMHDYCSFVSNESLEERMVAAMVQTDNFYINSHTQTDNLTTQDAQTQTDDNLKASDILNNNKLLRQYTGIPNAGTFKVIFDSLPSLPSTSKTKTFLEPIDEFILTLMRLRLALPLFDLAFRFSISQPTCSRIITKWINSMYTHLSFMTFWPSRGQINTTMPTDFKTTYPNTRVIIDCTELYTQTPSKLSHRSLMYSHYKSHMTFKALVGITPNGVVSFVSDLWAGSVSDKQIVIKSGLLDLCEEGDAIMADKGFLISDLTTPRKISLIVPPKLAKRKQMSVKDVVTTRRIANLRIHVERHMERVKRFKLLHNLKGNMKLTASKIWKITNHLTTLHPPLHPHDSSK